MKSEKDVREMLAYWEEHKDFPGVNIVITALKEVLEET